MTTEETTALILSGQTGTMIDLLPTDERAGIANEPTPEPTEKTCNQCGQTKPISAFYRVTKGGKIRGMCKQCYTRRYYGKDYGERKARKAAATPATPTVVIEDTPGQGDQRGGQTVSQPEPAKAQKKSRKTAPKKDQTASRPADQPAA
jgi:hypothetical protein